MNGFQQSVSQREKFIDELRSCLLSPSFDIDKDLKLSNKTKNRVTLLALNYDRHDVVRVLASLEVSDYYETVYESEAKEDPPYLLVFHKTVKRTQLYIKVKITDKDKKVICVSFHEAEFPM